MSQHPLYRVKGKLYRAEPGDGCIGCAFSDRAGCEVFPCMEPDGDFIAKRIPPSLTIPPTVTIEEC